MRSRIIFLVCFVFALTASTAAQSRSVTNSSIESYKQERLKIEREYRENYERLGMPSPEELERRNAKSAKEMAELAGTLRAEEIEREHLASQRATALRQISVYRQPVFVGVSDNVIYSYSWRARGHHWTPRKHKYEQPGYFAGGQFWPTGSATPARPMFVTPRR